MCFLLTCTRFATLRGAMVTVTLVVLLAIFTPLVVGETRLGLPPLPALLLSSHSLFLLSFVSWVGISFLYLVFIVVFLFISLSLYMSVSVSVSLLVTIRTETIWNENLDILFRFRFRNGQASKFPEIFFRICFRSDHVGHAQARTAGHTYVIKIKIPEMFFCFRFRNWAERNS